MASSYQSSVQYLYEPAKKTMTAHGKRRWRCFSSHLWIFYIHTSASSSTGNSLLIFLINNCKKSPAKLIKDGKTRVDNLIGYYRLAAKKKLPREHITQLVVFLEWIVALPESFTPYYNEQLEHLEEDNKMTYISIIERQGIEKGIEQGIERGIDQGIDRGRAATLYKQLQLKFGEQAAEFEQRLYQAEDVELSLWTERVLFAQTIEAVFAEP